MDFFVLPKELTKWVGDLLVDADHWVLAWNVRPSTYSMISRADDPILRRYAKEKEDNNIQLFIGNTNFRSGPVMEAVDSKKKRIDFRESLCIQVVPSFIFGDILLKGSIGTLDPKEYDDVPEEKQFMLWRNRIYQSFKETLSDASIVATQLLSDGTVKEWKGLVVSSGALEWYRRGGKLKEFPKGPVEFIPKA